MPRKSRTKRRRDVVKQSELLSVLKYLIPKHGIVKTLSGDINPSFFQSRGGYTNPYLLQSAEQKVVHDINKAYITIKTDSVPGSQFTGDNKTQVVGISSSGDPRIDTARKLKYIEEEFKKRGQNKPTQSVLSGAKYGFGGNTEQTYDAIMEGRLNWTAIEEYNKLHPKPDKKVSEKKNN